MMTFGKIGGLSCLALFLVLAPDASAVPNTAGVEFNLEIRSCAEGTGTFIKGGGCWVMDPKKGASFYEYQACIGLVVDAGILIAGAQGSVMLCGTLKVPIELAQDKKVWQEVAKERLRAKLTEPGFLRDIRGALRKDFKGVTIRPVQEADPATAAQNKKAIQRSQKK